jgi:hypothetical protein
MFAINGGTSGSTLPAFTTKQDATEQGVKKWHD